MGAKWGRRKKDKTSEENNYKISKRDECPKLKKPVIYLYPENTMDIEVKLKIKNDKLTCIYPKFNENDNTWKIKASPDGTIVIKDKKYPYLFWESESYANQDLSSGFIVKAENAENFLEEKLKKLGLNEKETCDFITFWLPLLLKNKISLCSFQSEKFFENFLLDVSPKPKTMIRVFLSIKKLEKEIEVKEQEIKEIKREGFTVVEWGGSDIQD